MRPWIERAIWSQIPALIYLLAARIHHFERHPRFVQIPHLGNERVPYRLTLDHYIRLQRLLRIDLERHRPERRLQLLRAGRLDSEHVHVQIIPCLQKRRRPLQLFIKAVVEGHRGVSRYPPVRRQHPHFRTRVPQVDRLALHVAALARCVVSGIKHKRVLLRVLRPLPLVIRAERPNPLVVVQHYRQVCLVACRAELR